MIPKRIITHGRVNGERAIMAPYPHDRPITAQFARVPEGYTLCETELDYVDLVGADGTTRAFEWEIVPRGAKIELDLPLSR